jgi:uncharacterized protein YjlB
MFRRTGQTSRAFQRQTGGAVSFGEQVKKAAEQATSIDRLSSDELVTLVNRRAPQRHHFEDDGKTPNNPRLPLLHYRDVLRSRDGLDPAALCEDLFAAHGWAGSWRNGIYPFLHFHTATHEVLGIARGSAHVQFGGDRGKTLSVEAGDVIVLPAGTSHRRISASDDLLVVGAYPKGSDYDEPRTGGVDLGVARTRISKLPLPAQDPVYGKDGPLADAWRAARESANTRNR